ncbi:GTP cyclohydrolase II [Catenovulum sp. SM1970]|uniref:GTP cyclohydrolase II n=1 Tax=Marinifaba aquimaris TaxID=2741323 RepID=UPI0015726F13|nr:GTP cyclohydrolase II [Marinifaba aquimaris]NTS76466.1 GTP cyclohydrolase II [Marinifaba aquimaris]
MPNEVRARAVLKVGANSDIPAEIVSFTDFDRDNEHIAMVFGSADSAQDAPLVRIHSECLTGDVFHSSRCDCGEQLDESIQLMSQQGGIILYLRQEGRGIGLYNKIDAYVLQSQGMNTYEANEHLGFKDDERSFDDAVSMLQAMGVKKLKLMTNNPRKIKAMEAEFELIEHVSTSIHLKEDNTQYLKTKKERGEHKLKL